MKRKTNVLKELDQLLRQACLLRDRFRCLRCSKAPAARSNHSTEGPSVVLQAAHIYGKGAYPAMRYEPENVIILCKGCHYRWWHAIGREAAPRNAIRAWCEETLGRDRMARLDLMAQTRRRHQWSPEATRLYLEDQIDRRISMPS